MQRQISDASPLGELLDDTRGVVGAVVSTAKGELVAISGNPVNAEATAKAAAAIADQLARVAAVIGLGQLEVASVKAASAGRVIANQAGSLAAIELDARRPLGELETRLRTLPWAASGDRPKSDRETTATEDLPGLRDVRVVTVPPPPSATARPSPQPVRATPVPSSAFRQPARPSPSVPLPPSRPTPSVPVPPPVASDLPPAGAPPRPRTPSASASGSRPLPLPLAPPPLEAEERPTPFPAVPSRSSSGTGRPAPLSVPVRATPQHTKAPSAAAAASSTASTSGPLGRVASSSPGIPAQMRPTGSGPVFAGDLEEFGLPDLLELLRNSQRTGLLKCTTAAGIGTVQLSRGMIIGAASPHALDLRQHFLTSPEVGPELRRVLAALPPESFADDAIDGALVSRELMPKDEVERAKVARIFSAFREMIGWTAGRFAFDPAVPVMANSALALSAQTILMRIFQEQDDQGSE